MELHLSASTRYDQAARYLLLQPRELLFCWLLRRSPDQIGFTRWLPTQLTLPGVPQRLCDGIAELVDLDRNGLPFAALLEVQTVPDAAMPGRLLLAGGLAWLTLRPTPLPGDRYELLGIVLNLTGVGDAARDCVLGPARWTLKPIEVNLETLDAAVTLEEIAGGTAPRELLPFIPLMRCDDQDAIIQRWRAIVETESDPRRRGDAALVRVFAERAGRLAAWQRALEGFTMIESPLIAELLAGAEVKGRVETLLRILRKRWGELPEELAGPIRTCTDDDQIHRWLDHAIEATSLADFRQRTGL